MRNVLIAVGVLALLSTAAIVMVHQQNEAELEKIHFHIPKFHIPHIIKAHLKLKNIAGCGSAIYSATTKCGAAYDSAGMDIFGDIGCVKGVLGAHKCAHIF